MTEEHREKDTPGLLVLGLIWLIGAVSDRLWFALDRSVPAWDQAEYLTGTLNYWREWQHPHWFSGEWWTHLWTLSTKLPPLTYFLTVPFLNLFGTGPDRATLVYLLFSAILLLSLYGLGIRLFNRQVALWASAICILLPGLYRIRLQFLLDYPLTTAITLCFYCLTLWKTEMQENKSGVSRDRAKDRRIFSPRVFSYLWAIAFGLSLGCAILIKQTTLLFLFTPIVWLGIGLLRQRSWERLGQLVGSLFLSVAVFGPWAKTNWLLILSGSKRATIDSAIAEGDPSLLSLEAWTYYWRQLPEHVSWPLLLLPLVGLLLYGYRGRKKAEVTFKIPASLQWLAVFWIGAYVINSLNLNKDVRYVLPYLPVLSLFLAYGLTLWPRRWGRQVRWGTLSVALLLMLLNLWPLGGALGSNLKTLLSPGNAAYPYLGKDWPHQELITEIIDTDPYLQSTLGVLPSTPEVNQHNLNYYGALENFQVYGRQVGTQLEQVAADVRSLSWFVTKTGEQGSLRKRVRKAQAAIVKMVETEGDFDLKRTWILPDNTNLNLYHRKLPQVEVKTLTEARSQVTLERVTVPEKAPPGLPLPVTYEWSGPWQQLQSGLVLLTWKKQSESQKAEPTPISQKTIAPLKSRWLHDHGIAMGALHPGPLKANEFPTGFRIIERMAMLPPADIAPGTYTLKAVYLNRETNETYPLQVPAIALKIDSAAVASPSPEVDLVSQLRLMAVNLPKGLAGLEPIFNQIGRINQYDPNQDYVLQAEQTLAFRLQREPDNLEWAYALAFSRVLQQKVEPAIAALEQVAQLDRQNPNAYAYLAFTHLYNWQPKAAQTVLKSAFAINPNLPEIRVLNGIAGLMQGNLLQAWRDLQAIDRLKV